MTVIPGAVFSGSVDGHSRAYSTATGEVIWDHAAWTRSMLSHGFTQMCADKHFGPVRVDRR
jgi:hypothetical protein